MCRFCCETERVSSHWNLVYATQYLSLEHNIISDICFLRGMYLMLLNNYSFWPTYTLVHLYYSKTCTYFVKGLSAIFY